MRCTTRVDHRDSILTGWLPAWEAPRAPRTRGWGNQALVSRASYAPEMVANGWQRLATATAAGIAWCSVVYQENRVCFALPTVTTSPKARGSTCGRAYKSTRTAKRRAVVPHGRIAIAQQAPYHGRITSVELRPNLDLFVR